MTEPMFPLCHTCPYWDIFEFFLPDGVNDTQHNGESDEQFIARLTEEGQIVSAPCKRHAPRYSDVIRVDDDHPSVAFWAYTDNCDWCGEHPDFPAYLAARHAKRDATGRDIKTEDES